MQITIVPAQNSNSNSNSNNSENNIRLITLAPHLAELVASAGAIEHLVGVVAYSDFPQQVHSITQVGDAFKLDYETIIALKPDYVLSWKGGTAVATVNKLKSLNLVVIEIEIKHLADIPKAILRIADLTQNQYSAQIALASTTQFEQTLKTLQPQTQHNHSIFIQTNPQPLYTVSSQHWMSEAVEFCGYKNIFADLSPASITVNTEAVIQKNPQFILNISKQADFQWQKWHSIDAVKNNHILTIDPDDLTRPSMRILQGIKQLCDYQENN